MVNCVKVNVEWVDVEVFDKVDVVLYFEGYYVIFVLGGFGECGIEGKIKVV